MLTSIENSPELSAKLKALLEIDFPGQSIRDIARTLNLTPSTLYLALSAKGRIPRALAERYGIGHQPLPHALTDAQIVDWLRTQPGTKVSLAKRLEMPYATLIALLRGKCRVPGYLARRFGQNRPETRRGRPRS